MDAEALHLGPDDVAEPLGQRRVPGLGERGADGDGGGVLLADLGGFAGFGLVGDAEGLASGIVHELEEGGGQAGVSQGEGALGVDAVGGGQAQASGPIGHDDAGQAGDPGGGLARRSDDGGGGRSDDGVRSPIYGDLSGLKKVTTFVGTREILLTDNALFHAKLLEAGGDSTLHVGEGLDHVYPMFPTPEGHRARRDLVRIVTGELT